MDYNEELGKILANSELDETGKATAIAKLTGECFVSKSNHNKALKTMQTELDNTKTELGTTKTELDTLKTSQMTEDEKLQKALEEAQEATRKANIRENKMEAKDILSDIIEDKKELADIIESITTDNLENTKEVAQKLAETMKKQKEATEAKVRQELINNTPKPNGGEQDKPMTKEAFVKLSYNEQVKYKTENPEGYKQLFN